MAETTASGYIQHHLQNLTFGQLPNGGWGFAHTAQEAKEMGFWAFHVDTLGWSVFLGLIFILLFRMAAKRATSGQQPMAFMQIGGLLRVHGKVSLDRERRSHNNGKNGPIIRPDEMANRAPRAGSHESRPGCAKSASARR